MPLASDNVTREAPTTLRAMRQWISAYSAYSLKRQAGASKEEAAPVGSKSSRYIGWGGGGGVTNATRLGQPIGRKGESEWRAGADFRPRAIAPAARIAIRLLLSFEL